MGGRQQSNDAIGRLTGHASDLGAFSLSYLGQTAQITQRQLLPAGSNLATSWSYLPNSGDRRLAGIGNDGLSSSQHSNYAYTTTPENFITAVAETSDAPPVYPSATTQTASYNNLNQLTNLSGQALSYDADGSLLADGQRTYAWDAENRLVGISYPGQPGKATAFAYDGLGRRTAIASTPAGGGSAVTTFYIWCGTRPCQARNSGNSPTRKYYVEGELVPGSPTQPYYYGADQIDSVRRVFASATSAPAYSYDPYGNPLQATPPLTDFGYAGMFYNADSGLYLTQYRTYDPVAGRWLSRDPIGESSDLAANLYRYVDGNPLNSSDPAGLGPIGTAAGGVAGGIIAIAGSIAVDAGTGGLNILATPAEVAAGIAAGAAIGNALEDTLRGFCPFGPISHQASRSRGLQGIPGSTTYGSGGSRTYGPDGYPGTDVDIGHDHGAGDPHAHDWGRPGNGAPPTARDRGPGRPVEPGDPSPTPP